MTQHEMFDPPPPAVEGSPTSALAAEEIAPLTGQLRLRYLHWLREQGVWGATDEEAQEGLGMPASTQRPRRVECVKLGLVEPSGNTRRTRSGRKAVVWLALEKRS